MNKKRWALLLILALLVFGYIKLFYKTYSVNAVVKNADCIVALDVKRITNTLLWNIITTPSQWKSINFSSSKKDEVDWKDMVKIPDYVLAFHVKEQPAGIWYLVLQVKDEEDFAKGLQRYHFEKISTAAYTSKDLGISFFKHNGKILLTNTIAGNNNYLTAVANVLFIKKEYITKQSLQKAIDAKSHLAVYIAANNFLEEDAIITVNFDKRKIELHSDLTPRKQYSFPSYDFPLPYSTLLIAGCTQPGGAVYHLLDATAKDNISKALNLNMDSVFRQDNQFYLLDVSSIQPRIDSAVSYSYDDDFNKVEKMVVNKVLEPSYNFTIGGDSIKNIYRYFVQSNKLELTDSGKLFTPVPFVRSYCETSNEKTLNISTPDYPKKVNASMSAIFFLNIDISKIPADLLKYVPDAVNKAIGNIESIQLNANKKNEQLEINGVIQKKKNDLPIIKL